MDTQELLIEYKGLSKTTRGKASKIWALEIMHRLGALDGASLLYELGDLKGRSMATTQERNSNFWYQKLNSIGVLHARKIDNIQRYFPDINLYLIHPIWQLLDGMSPMTKTMIDLTNGICAKHKLPLTVEVVVSSIQPTHNIKQALKKIALLNDFDGLFCLLVIQAQLCIDTNVKPYINQLAFNLFCRLMIIRYPKKYSPAVTLFQDIEAGMFSHLLVEPDNESPPMSIIDQLSKSFKGFGEEDNVLELQEYLFAAKALMAKVIRRKLLPNSETAQHAFLYFALQKNLASLYDELDERHENNLKPRLNEILTKTPSIIELMK